MVVKMAFATYVRLTCLLHTANQTLDVIKVVAVCGRPAFARGYGAASCFWHGCPLHFIKPRGNAAFWRRKISANRARDRFVNRTLRRMGWRVLRVWEHELARRNEALLLGRLGRALGG